MACWSLLRWSCPWSCSSVAFAIFLLRVKTVLKLWGFLRCPLKDRIFCNAGCVKPTVIPAWILVKGECRLVDFGDDFYFLLFSCWRFCDRRALVECFSIWCTGVSLLTLDVDFISWRFVLMVFGDVFGGAWRGIHQLSFVLMVLVMFLVVLDADFISWRFVLMVSGRPSVVFVIILWRKTVLTVWFVL